MDTTPGHDNRTLMHFLCAIFGIEVRQVGHPWTRHQDTTPDKIETVPVAEQPTKKVTWGADRTVKAVVQVDESLATFGWDLTASRGQKARMPDEMTEHDYSVIKRKNVDQVLYEQVRPYIIAGKTNAEIAAVLGCSKSRIDSTCARVREAIINYQKTPPLLKR